MICSKEELDKIIEYLQSICEEINEEYIDPNEHWHYSDYNDDWTEKDSELVVFINNIEKKKIIKLQFNEQVIFTICFFNTLTKVI